MQRGLPVSLLIKYFHKAGTGWEINPDIRAMVQFREHNLLRDDGELGVFDVIFCRNVLIYFDDATKRQVLARLALHQFDLDLGQGRALASGANLAGVEAKRRARAIGAGTIRQGSILNCDR